MTREEIVNKLLEGGKLLPVMTEFEAREVVNYVIDNYYQQAQMVQPDYTYNSKEFLEKKIEELHKEVEVLKKEQPSSLDEAQKKDCFDKYNEDVDAVFGSSRYSEKGLNEAFRSFMNSTEYPPANQDEERMALDAFKAGAKWDAEQGVLNC